MENNVFGRLKKNRTKIIIIPDLTQYEHNYNHILKIISKHTLCYIFIPFFFKCKNIAKQILNNNLNCNIYSKLLE